MTGRNDLITEALRQLREMRYTGMADELTEVVSNPENQNLSTYELLSRIVDAEYRRRNDTRIKRLTKLAGFTDPGASLDQLNYKPERKLNKNLIDQLRTNDYIPNHRNVIIEGPTGAGKSFMAQALGYHACNNGYHVKYLGMFDLSEDFATHNTPEGIMATLRRLSKPDVLIIDDFMMNNVFNYTQEYLLKLIDLRYGKGSIIISSQLMDVEWKHKITDPAIGEAILDRLVHNAFRITIEGSSMRENKE
jgi:DNA replication protein DnaC